MRNNFLSEVLTQGALTQLSPAIIITNVIIFTNDYYYVMIIIKNF